MNKCHFIGIGGIGMSALAKILMEKKVEVSGSDCKSSQITDQLIKNGATISFEHHEKNIFSDHTVIFSSGICKENPEMIAANKLNCKMLHRSELLAKICADYQTLAVTGAHGKTTTSALLTHVLQAAGQKPSFAVGGVVKDFQSNSHIQEGSHFVIEADESDGSFLNYKPAGAIITNVEIEHLDYWKSEQRLKEAYQSFAKQVQCKDLLFYCKESAGFSCDGISYGTDDCCSLRLVNYYQKGWSTFFTASFKGRVYENIELSLLGRHNALNALAVFGLCINLGLDEKAIRQGLKTFSGVKRRQDVVADERGVLFVDDYAHHPTEVAATLKALRQAVEDRRLIVLFEPHRYSRTADCKNLWGRCFVDADLAFITDIYTAGEAEISDISAQTIVDEVKKRSKTDVRYLSKQNVLEEILNQLRPHDVLVTMGAGSVTAYGPEIADQLKKRSFKKLKLGLLFGGKSEEHPISLKSAEYVRANINHDIYDLVDLEISKTGKFCFKKLAACQAVIPMLHGPFGEDGTVQGMFEALGIAYAGSDFRASAIAMDKALTKKVLSHEGVRVVPFVSFTEHQWRFDKEFFLQRIQTELTYPLFVKAAHLGSSIGITKIESKGGLEDAINESFAHDTKVIVENQIIGREIEFAVLGSDFPAVFPPGEVLADGKFYDYVAKYSKNCFKTTMRAELSDDICQEGMKIAKMAYQMIGCRGFARVDTFLDREGRFWLNEINTIPGFTSISLYPAIVQAGGIGPQELIDRLVNLALRKR